MIKFNDFVNESSSKNNIKTLLEIKISKNKITLVDLTYATAESIAKTLKSNGINFNYDYKKAAKNSTPGKFEKQMIQIMDEMTVTELQNIFPKAMIYVKK